jgi:AbiU2
VSTTLSRLKSDFETVKHSLMDLGAKRLIHKAHIKELKHPYVDDGTGVVHRWAQENYADSMLIGLRRLLDDRRGSLSLIRLLKQVEQDHLLFSADWYIRFWAKEHSRTNEKYARLLYARFSRNGRTLDQQQIRADVDKMRSDGAKILRYINTVVAHHGDNTQRTGLAISITWEDLDKLFDDVTGMFNKYYGLVRPGIHIDFEPVLPAGFEQAFKRMMDTRNHR